MTHDEISTTIQQRLCAKGWTQSDAAIATKDYETAAGGRTAIAFLSPGDGINYVLQGDYQSEGHNILEPRGQLIPVDVKPDALEKIIETFILDTGKAIEDSYAVRLLRQRQN